MKTTHLAVCLAVIVFALAASAAPPTVCGGNSCGPNCTIVTHTDQTSGKTIWRLKNDTKHEHNIYYYRDAWNANNTKMVAVHMDQFQQNWTLHLYDEHACYLGQAFTLNDYDWRVVWDKTDSNIMYSIKGNVLYKLNTSTFPVTPTALKTFDNLTEGYPLTNGVSLNQAGTRILVTTQINGSGQTRLNTFDLPGMTNPRVIVIDNIDPSTPNCAINTDKIRYTGYQNRVHAGCNVPLLTLCACGGPQSGYEKVRIYDDVTGQLVKSYGSSLNFGHLAYSAEGHFGYYRYNPSGDGSMEIRVCDTLSAAVCGSQPFGTSTSDDKIVLSPTGAQMTDVQSLHLNWGSAVTGRNMWMIASFYPKTVATPTTDPTWYHDEILKINHKASPVTYSVLGHSRTLYEGQWFWTMTVGAINKDGTKITFNSDRRWDTKNVTPAPPLGTIDVHILYP